MAQAFVEPRASMAGARMPGTSTTSSKGSRTPKCDEDCNFESDWGFYLNELQKGREDGRGSPSDDGKLGKWLASSMWAEAGPGRPTGEDAAPAEQTDEDRERRKQIHKLEKVYKQEVRKDMEREAIDDNERTRSRRLRKPSTEEKTEDGKWKKDSMHEAVSAAPSAPMYGLGLLTPPHALETYENIEATTHGNMREEWTESDPAKTDTSHEHPKSSLETHACKSFPKHAALRGE